MRTPETTGNALFDRFWAAYPRKVGKPKALRAFEKLHADEKLLETMLTAVARQTKALGWNDKAKWKYIPHPVTWLNQRRWEDEVGGNTRKPDTPDPHTGCCTVIE